MKLSDNKFFESQAKNKSYENSDKLLLLLVFPLFKIKNAFEYAQSQLYKILSCGKDVFYRLLNNEILDWRSLQYSVTKKLIKELDALKENTLVVDNPPRCLIVDDTDLPKTGRFIELIGRIYSHVSNSNILAFKGLFMAYHDGTSLFALDFSLHGEVGKNKKNLFESVSNKARKDMPRKEQKSALASFVALSIPFQKFNK